MSMSDPIADLLTHMRNAQTRGLKSVELPSSRMKKAIVGLLLEEGYIAGFEEQPAGSGKNVLRIALKYYNGRPVMEKLQRISRPGLRIYKGADDLPVVKGGLGETIVSTSRGLMTARKAREARVGGELLCLVY